MHGCRHYDSFSNITATVCGTPHRRPCREAGCGGDKDRSAGKLLRTVKRVYDSDEPITIRYLYDDSGELYGMDYNGTGYFGFIKNLQGDIVSIVPLDSESNVELNMEYDAWGKPIYTQASSAAEGLLMAIMMLVTNVGYRGYFYDFDTGLYYLRSRYYDPES